MCEENGWHGEHAAWYRSYIGSTQQKRTQAWEEKQRRKWQRKIKKNLRKNA